VSYTTEDFGESLSRVDLDRTTIDRVVAAWGMGDGQGRDAGHNRWSDTSVTEWAGGFLMRLRDGRYAYLTGWCDYTGWGCQDGASLTYYDREPDKTALLGPRAHDYPDEGPPDPDTWDVEPTDLNRWLRMETAE
jgi:hypothetical protein